MCVYADTRSLEYAVTGRYRARCMVPRLVASAMFLLLFVLAAYFGKWDNAINECFISKQSHASQPRAPACTQHIMHSIECYVLYISRCSAIADKQT